LEAEMKVVLRVLAVLLILVGIVWILQGINVLGGSMMSGHIQYALLGVVAGIIGGGLWYLSNRRPRML
jgi:hypothetical protein